MGFMSKFRRYGSIVTFLLSVWQAAFITLLLIAIFTYVAVHPRTTCDPRDRATKFCNNTP